MKVFLVVFFSVLILLACNQKDCYIIEKQRFFFPRSERQFMNRVKSVIETQIITDTTYRSGEVSKTTSVDKYQFSEQGALSGWISEYNGNIDLKFSGNGSGVSKTRFLSEKTNKEEIRSWSQEDTFHILTTKVKIDGKNTRTIIGKYNSEYNIVSEDYITPNDEIQSFNYIYNNGRLAEVIGSTLSTKYSYAENIDTVRNFFRRQLQSTSIKYYNRHGDTERLWIQGMDKSVSEMIYEYEYDSKQNWILRKKISKNLFSGKLSITKRDITYY